MLPRYYRRSRRKKILLVLASLLVFAGGIWLSLYLATPTALKRVRVPRSSTTRALPYHVDTERQAIKFRGEVGEGHEQEFEVIGTEDGLVIRPTEGP